MWFEVKTGRPKVFTLKSAWSFHNPARIHFGRGVRRQLADELMGKRCLIVTTERGRRQFSNDAIFSSLIQNTEIRWLDTVKTNPGIAEIQAEIDRTRDEAFDVVIAFGGGSVMDSAKVLAVALAGSNTRTSLKQLLRNPDLSKVAQPKPLYAFPTTAGTGSEVTPSATVWDYEQKRKHALSGHFVLPYAACVDPELTDALPLEVTLSTGLDAINQAAESIWNKNATPVTLDLAIRALQLGFYALPRLVEGQGSAAERDQMAECSLLAGLAISQTRTALCHSMSYPLTARFGVPHGLACAFTMLAVLRLNLAADDGRFSIVTERLIGLGGEPEALLGLFADLCARAGVAASVRRYIPDRKNLIALADEMFTRGRADNNLADIGAPQIKEILLESVDYLRNPGIN